MLIADRQTLAGLYPYMLWITPGNQETNAILIADRQALKMALDGDSGVAMGGPGGAHAPPLKVCAPPGAPPLTILQNLQNSLVVFTNCMCAPPM